MNQEPTEEDIQRRIERLKKTTSRSWDWAPAAKARGLTTSELIRQVAVAELQAGIED
jgi:hypothetical protein